MHYFTFRFSPVFISFLVFLIVLCPLFNVFIPPMHFVLTVFFVTSGCFSRASWINFEFLFTLFWCNIFHFRGLGFSVWVVATFSNRFWKYWAIDQRPLKYLQTTTGFVYLHLVVWRQGHLHLSRDCLWKAVSTAFMCVLSVCTSIFICLGRPFNVSGLKYPQRISDKLLLGIYL